MPALPSLPRSAEVYSAAQRREIRAAVNAIRRRWRRMGDDFDASWLAVAPQMLAILDTAQERVAAGALAYMPAVLAETGQPLYDPAYTVESGALIGSAGDGRPTESLLYGGVTHAKEAVAAGASVSQALATASSFITVAAGTVLSDTGRTAEKMAGHARRVTGYVRMLTPPSCGRCVVLAGSWTSAKTAFKRHPGCDCRNIPQAEATSDDLTVSPEAYLGSLDDAALSKALGSKANAQAFRDGADPIQIVNAYRSGVRPAQQFNSRIKYTLEGTTRRGLAFRAMESAGVLGGTARRQVGGRVVTARNIRLMPETIYARAANRVQALQMLRDYGWIR
jgi:hypothetical protein